MNARTFALFACLVAAVLPGCLADPDTGRVAQAGPGEPIPAPEISIDLPLENNEPQRHAPPRPCLIGRTRSCEDLDSRPFEPCLVTDKDCSEKGEGEFMPLERPVRSEAVLKPR